MTRPTRQELYERIRNSSMDEVIVEEMRRLGFWPQRGQIPGDPAEEVEQRGRLQRKLQSLRSEFQRLNDEEAMLRALRKRRMAESREKRKETKLRRQRERVERAEAHRERQANTVSYLGEGFSNSLGHLEHDAERLAQHDLPLLSTSADLAQAMAISVGELRFLAYGRNTSTVGHYVRFLLPKKTGGNRLISAPMPRLKAAQAWINERILSKIELHDAAHGFVANRSIVSNAKPHVDSEVVINLDLKDFFPTVTYKRTRGMYRALGYSGAVSTLFALLCTQPDVEEVELDGTRYFVGRGERHLPQGSPASPAITNVICRRLDRRLAGLANELGFRYTRYADDLTFSSEGKTKQIGCLLRAVSDIVEHEGFTVHPDKTRVMRRGSRQEVTGIVVNSASRNGGLGVSRDQLRRFRALLHHVERDGPGGKTWGPCGDVLTSMQGFASFVAMVDRDKGNALLERVRELMKTHRYEMPKGKPAIAASRWQLAGHAPPPAKEGPAQTAQSTATDSTDTEKRAPEAKAAETPKKPWWKFW